MEVTIIKKLFLTVDIDVPTEEMTQERVAEEVKKVIAEYDDEGFECWDEYNWNGQKEYEAYETYSGTDIEIGF